MERDNLASLASSLVEDMTYRENPLETSQQFRARQSAVVKEKLEKMIGAMTEGYGLLLDQINVKREAGEEVCDANVFVIEPDSLDKVKDDDSVLQKQLGLSDKALLDLYAAANELFEGGNYEEAAKGYLVIIMLNPKVSTFWASYATALMRLNNSHKAQEAYLAAIAAAPENIDHYLSFVNCCLKNDRRNDAQDLISAALDYCKELEDGNQELEQTLQQLRGQIESY